LVRRDGLRLPIHRELAPLVTILMDLTELAGYDIRPDWTWGYACLAGDTLVTTPDGDVAIAALAGTEATLLTRHAGYEALAGWVQAPVRSYGVQPLMRLTLSRWGVEREVYATPEHRWIVEYSRFGIDGGYAQAERQTQDLLPGTVLAAVRADRSTSFLREEALVGVGGRSSAELKPEPDAFAFPVLRAPWDLARWTVEAVETTDRVEEVFCAQVAGTESFALADDLLTGNCRPIAGTSIPSNHSWGTAVDINAPVNPRKRPLTTNIPRAVREMWKSQGFRWGGDYTTSVPDPMHFEFMGTVTDARHRAAALSAFLGGRAAPVPQPPPTAAGERGRIMELQRLLRVTADGIIGPITVAAMKRNMIGWHRDLAGNHNPNLVSWLQRQGRRKGYALRVDGIVGPEVNHLIVVVLGQRDGICGERGYRAAVR
jgi:hypothetical protein